MLHSVGDKMLGGTGKTISLIVAATVLIALIGTTLACLNTGVRVTYAMAKDSEMPSILGLLHGKFATPHGGVWVLTGVSALLGIYGVNPASADNVTQITLASNFGTFLVYGFSCLIAITAFAHRHDKHIFKHYIVPAVGALMNVVDAVRGRLPGLRLGRGDRARRHHLPRDRRGVDRARRGLGAAQPEAEGHRS